MYSFGQGPNFQKFARLERCSCGTWGSLALVSVTIFWWFVLWFVYSYIQTIACTSTCVGFRWLRFCWALTCGKRRMIMMYVISWIPGFGNWHVSLRNCSKLVENSQIYHGDRFAYSLTDAWRWSATHIWSLLGAIYTMGHEVVSRLCKICDWLLNSSQHHSGLH